MVMLTEEMVIARTKSSNLETVTKFNCWGSQLSDVSILRKMKNVTVLSLSVNSIDTLEVFQFCTKLQDLFIRKNNIKELNQVCYLQDLAELKCLWLEENPCCSNDAEHYRLAVIKALPKLKKLDNVEVEPSEVEMAQRVGKRLIHPEEMPEYYSNSTTDEEDNIYTGQRNEEESSPSPEIEYRQRNNYTPEPIMYQRGNRDFNNSYEQVNELNTYNRETGDSRDIYAAEPLQNNQNQNQLNHRQQMSQSYKYEEEPAPRQQNHRPQGLLPRSKTTDGELGHISCPNCCNVPQQTQRRPNERRTNVLNAVLCLVKELDYPNLEVVQMAIKCRMEELCEQM